MCNQCIDCFFYMGNSPDDGYSERSLYAPDASVEIKHSDPTCSHFELSDSAANLKTLLAAAGRVSLLGNYALDR